MSYFFWSPAILAPAFPRSWKSALNLISTEDKLVCFRKFKVLWWTVYWFLQSWRVHSLCGHAGLNQRFTLYHECTFAEVAFLRVFSVESRALSWGHGHPWACQHEDGFLYSRTSASTGPGSSTPAECANSLCFRSAAVFRANKSIILSGHPRQLFL